MPNPRGTSSLVGRDPTDVASPGVGPDPRPDPRPLAARASVDSVPRGGELELIYRTAPVGLGVIDRDLRFVRVNDWLARINGRRIEDHIGRTVREVVPDVADQAEAMLRHVLATGEPLRDREVVGETPARPGLRRTWVAHWSPLRDERAEIVGVSFVVQDVTGRRRAEDALRESESLFRAVAEQAAVGIAMTDLDGRVMYINDRYCAIFGRTREQILGRSFESFTHPDDLARSRPLRLRTLATGEPFVIEKRHVQPDGTVVWVRNSVGPRRAADGRIVGTLKVSIDLTERVRAEQALREADARKDEFLAMLAHELRNPLAPLVNAHRLLERAEPLGVRGAQLLALAKRQTRQLQRLVDDLLEISRITRGRIEIRPEPTSVGAAVRAAVETLMPQFEERRQRVTEDLPEPVPPIVADPARIAQILENLLQNASKFTPEGGSIRVEVDDRPGEVEIRVIDDGIGIEPAKIPQLFTPFHQLDSTLDRAQGGLGLGLALVKRLVELHGGHVAACSDGPGTGATFAVVLPRGSC